MQLPSRDSTRVRCSRQESRSRLRRFRHRWSRTRLNHRGAEPWPQRGRYDRLCFGLVWPPGWKRSGKNCRWKPLLNALCYVTSIGEFAKPHLQTRTRAVPGHSMCDGRCTVRSLSTQMTAESNIEISFILSGATWCILWGIPICCNLNC